MELGIIKKYGLPPNIDLITGVSVGALNGAVISGTTTDEEAIDKLEKIWAGIKGNSDVYSYSIFNPIRN